MSVLCARRLVLLAALAACLPVAPAQAHDPSAYGGLFRSRNFGGTWLNADVELFLGGSVSVAVNPTDGNHLLLGTEQAVNYVKKRKQFGKTIASFQVTQFKVAEMSTLIETQGI